MVKRFDEEPGKPVMKIRCIDPRRVTEVIFGGCRYQIDKKTNKDLKIEIKHSKMADIELNHWISSLTHELVLKKESNNT